MIAKQEIQMFKLLPSTISDLANRMKIYPGSATKIAETLINNGLAKKQRKGKYVILTREQTIHAQKLEEAFKAFPRLQLEEILTYSNLKIIAVLKYPLNKKEISQITNVSRQWAYKTIKNLSRYGIILKNQVGYYINPTHHLLFEFAKEYYNYKNHQKTKSISEDAQIIWQHGTEFLFKTKKVLTKYPITAVTAFSKYDLPLLDDTKYYYNTKRKLQTTDIVLHTILINPQSKTYNAYACLLYEKTKPTNIIKKARIYNLTEHIQSIILFIKNHESEKKFLPTWNEYKSLAKQYGIR